VIRHILALSAAFALSAACSEKSSGTTRNHPQKMDQSPAPAPVSRTDAEWRASLTPDQYHILREAGTEPAFGRAYEEFNKQGAGSYHCAGCGALLFSSGQKFDSHCGWPSFYDPAKAENVVTRDDFSLGRQRTEVICAKCGGHLGHVFKGEGFKTPTDKRYCINGVGIRFVPDGKE
jgi:peptide-methionine (R)-S-oxide reductase